MGSPTDPAKSKWRALLIAVRKGNLPRVQYLLTDNPGLALTPGPHSLLHNAVDSVANCTPMLRELLVSGVPPDTKNSASVCALHHAARNGCLACVRQLLTAGAQPDVRDAHDQTALHYAVRSSRGGNAACIQLLLERSTSIDVYCEAGLTPLHIAAQVGNVGAAKLLLKVGASPASKDVDGCTPLHLATTCGMAEVLLVAGADVTAQNNSLQTPLERAIEFHPAVAQTLLDAGVEVRGNPQEKDLRVFFHLNTVTGGSSPCEVDLLDQMAHCGHYDLLKHPLCEVFLHLKWYHVRPLFYIYSFIRVVLIISLTAFLTLKQQLCRKEKEFEKCHGSYEVSKDLETYMTALRVLAGMLLLLHFVVDGIRLLSLRSRFFRSLSSVITVIFLMSSAIQITDFIVTGWKVLGVLVILSGWFEVTRILSHSPALGIYVQLFKVVTLRMVKFTVVYFPIFIGFAFSFRVVLDSDKSDNTFKTPLSSGIKTLAMIAGELDYNNVLGEHLTAYPGTREILFVVFVLLMVVSTINLLVGLAVRDIHVLMKKAGVNRLALTVVMEMKVDEFFNSSFVSLCPGFFLHHLSNITTILPNLALKKLSLRRDSFQLRHVEQDEETANVNRRKATDKYFNVFVCPNRSNNPGKVFRNLKLSEHSGKDYEEKPAGYILPPWIIRNTKNLINSDSFRNKGMGH